MTALNTLVDTNGIYCTPAVYTRIKRGGTILTINTLPNNEFNKNLLNGQIDAAIDQL